MQKSIAYYRVSNERQGQSGLGLDAQQKTVEDFTKANGLRLMEEFIEVRSGTRDNRPRLTQALAECKSRMRFY